MDGEHVGRVSDSINNEESGGARARLKAVMQPSGREYKGGGPDLGNGEHCPAGHGKMYVLASGRQWCADQSHDAERMAQNG